MYKTWMESVYDKPGGEKKKNPYFFVTTEQSDGIFAKVQMISYSFIILKHIQIDLQF